MIESRAHLSMPAVEAERLVEMGWKKWSICKSRKHLDGSIKLWFFLFEVKLYMNKKVLLAGVYSRGRNSGLGFCRDQILLFVVHWVSCSFHCFDSNWCILLHLRGCPPSTWTNGMEMPLQSPPEHIHSQSYLRLDDLLTLTAKVEGHDKLECGHLETNHS